jgi:cytochrome c
MFQGYKKYIMASCDEADYQKANALGWRAFIVTKGAKRMPNSATCPASKEMGKRVNCIDCGACSGIDGRGKRNINIAQHK